jgi:hypothetical protein
VRRFFFSVLLFSVRSPELVRASFASVSRTFSLENNFIVLRRRIRAHEQPMFTLAVNNRRRSRDDGFACHYDSHGLFGKTLSKTRNIIAGPLREHFTIIPNNEEYSFRSDLSIAYCAPKISRTRSRGHKRITCDRLRINEVPSLRAPHRPPLVHPNNNYSKR